MNTEAIIYLPLSSLKLAWSESGWRNWRMFPKTTLYINPNGKIGSGKYPCLQILSNSKSLTWRLLKRKTYAMKLLNSALLPWVRAFLYKLFRSGQESGKSWGSFPFWISFWKERETKWMLDLRRSEVMALDCIWKRFIDQIINRQQHPTFNWQQTSKWTNLHFFDPIQ